MTPPLADQAARDRIREDLGDTLVVEAAAGTGKTSALVGRVVSALQAGRLRLDSMVALTFTEAAAGDLKLRLRTAIERARQRTRITNAEIEIRERLDRALPQLEEARIGTIHSFCADLLRERPVEARVDPLFVVAPDDVARPLFDRAFDRWFEAQLGAPGEAVRRIMRRAPRRDGSGPRDMLRAAAWDLVDRRDFETRWKPNMGFDRDQEIDVIMDELVALGGAAGGGDPADYFTRSLAEIGRFTNEATRREAVRGERDYDGLEGELTAFRGQSHWRWKGFRSGTPGFPKAELRGRRDSLKTRLDDFVTQAGADLAPKLRDELWPVVEDYERLKARAGCLDFLALLLRARDLVRDEESVRGELQRRFTHIFVDEFQDTDPLQAEILFLLAADDAAENDWRRVRPVPGKLFLVGDPKQSIYRFRRADVSLYDALKRQLVAAGASVVDLSVSFRSTPEIQDAVNAAFAPRMRGESFGEPRYVSMERFRESVVSRPSIVALPVPAPYGDRGYKKVVNWKIEESLPDVVAAFVKWLITESGWTVTAREQPGEKVTIGARHVCLLFKRFRSRFADYTHAYVRALEARGVAHVLIGGTSFHRREELEAIRNALAAIERPEDELAVFATLRGPLFALDDGDLLAFRHRCGTLHPFVELAHDLPEKLKDVGETLAALRALHVGRNRRPIADTVARLLAITRAHAGLAIWPTGAQALANVTRLLDMARRAERSGITSFRGFVDQLADQAERGDTGDAPIVEEGAEGVRLMTVHRAKGLEFPVVILCDITAPETLSEPRRWVDGQRSLCAMRLAGCSPPELLSNAGVELAREREEALRLLYVAATRARDLLVVSTVGDTRMDGWLAALSPVVYPAENRCREPETRQPPGCPPLGSESVLVRPPGVRIQRSVMPGLHRPEAGDHAVVWWDPALLDLGVKESVGLSQQRLLQADAGGVRSDQGIRAHAEWQNKRAVVRREAATPSIRVMTVTERAFAMTSGEGGDEAAERPGSRVTVLSVDAAGGGGEEPWGGAGASKGRPAALVNGRMRPRGKRFGTLVHAVLATVDLDADRPGIEAETRLRGRLLDASSEEVEAAGGVVARALTHPVVRRAAVAARAYRCRREAPVAVMLADGTLVEGVADAAFYEEEPEPNWTIIDFKTDVDIEGRLDQYKRQVELYSLAVERASGVPARGVLLRV